MSLVLCFLFFKYLSITSDAETHKHAILQAKDHAKANQKP